MRNQRIACDSRGGSLWQCMPARWQHAGDYHDRGVVAGHHLKAALQRDFHCTVVGGLDHSVQPAKACGSGNVDQRLQHAFADAAGAKPGEDHQSEFRRFVLGDVFAVAHDFAISTEGEDGNTAAMIERIEPPQQGQIRRSAMCEVALIEALVIHRRKKARDPVAIARNSGADRKMLRSCHPGQARSHDASPLTKSTVASITSGSSSMRR